MKSVCKFISSISSSNVIRALKGLLWTSMHVQFMVCLGSNSPTPPSKLRR